ncbi:MAG: hypothetical protein KIT31_33320, partial [Deltaproteobacteria bacterium]|nr:hypothetical protein [Deltaproteobacteria bacterium]
MWLCVAIAAWAIAGCGPSPQAGPDGGGDDRPDAAVLGDGTFGDACNTHGDCASGYCVQPVGDQVGSCSRTCNGDCPTGWDCLDVQFDTGMAKVCVPNVARECLPCGSDAECPGGACLDIDGGGRCEASCTSTAQCRPGYECLADATGAHAGKFCQPTSGSCTCDAQHVGEVRTCKNANAIGVCLGSQMCQGAAGWSACTAKTAAVETCNGEDDDCDFLVDNNVGGGEACTNTVPGVGSCPGIRTCDGATGFSCHGPIPTAEKCNGLDDDCNGQIDEIFPGLNTSCSAGVGACERFGAIACNATQDGTLCTAVAGTPVAEKCNHIDDDCDGGIDEDFPTLGTQCTAGVGTCARFGTIACDAAGAAACSATPGTPQAETCNFLDDNCNGFVDDGFLNPITGLYDLDVHNCGVCGNDCTTQFNFVNAHGECTTGAGVARCTMECAPGTFNLDGFTQNGCYFVLDAAGIYVAGDDITGVDDATCGLGPTGTAAGNHPCATIAQGLARAAATGRTTVYVADALYAESVTMRNGIALRGGFRNVTWQRHVASTNTTILGSAVLAGTHAATVIASNLTATTVLEGFVIRGSDNARIGGNSYAIYASNAAGLAVRDNHIFAGRGGPGAGGSAGVKGTTGTNGGPYSASLYDAYQATGSGFCNSSSNRGAYGAGNLSCGADAVGGGQGGGNNCTPSRSTQNSTSLAPGTAGQPGDGPGGGGGGAVGSRGFDATLNGNTCLLPVDGSGNLRPQFGADGSSGGAGA